MADIVIYDPADPTVAGRVTAYYPSANTPDYDAETNKLVNPSLVAVSGVPQKYWKESTGSVVEMSAGEKTSYDAAFPERGARTEVSDADYQMVSLDCIVTLIAITVDRTVKLPLIANCEVGKLFMFMDETGDCSGPKTWQIRPHDTDSVATINGATGLDFTTGYDKAHLYTNGTDWFQIS